MVSAGNEGKGKSRKSWRLDHIIHQKKCTDKNELLKFHQLILLTGKPFYQVFLEF
jgi:hypothetical protein